MGQPSIIGKGFGVKQRTKRTAATTPAARRARGKRRLLVQRLRVPRADEEQERRPDEPPAAQEPHRQEGERHQARDGRIPVAEQGEGDVPAVQLAGGDQVQHRNVQAQPSRVSDRVKEHVVARRALPPGRSAKGA